MRRTQHYNLVLFESSDKPTWLENWNSTMSHIDEVLYRISSGGGDLPDLSEVVARLEVLESQMSSANLQIQQNANNITSMQESIDTINATLVGLAETDSALQSNVTALQSSVSNIQTSLGTITTQLNNFSNDLSNAITEIDSVVTRVSNCERDIASIESSLGGGTPVYGLVYYKTGGGTVSFKKGDLITSNRSISTPENYNLSYVDYSSSSSAYIIDNIWILRQRTYLYIANGDYNNMPFTNQVGVYRRMNFPKLIDFNHTSQITALVSNMKGYAIKSLNEGSYENWWLLNQIYFGQIYTIGFVHPDYNGTDFEMTQQSVYHTV